MLEGLPVARPAEPAKIPPSSETVPSEVAKVLALPAGSARSKEIRHFVQVWAAKHPQQALAWTKQNTADFEQQQLINAILWEWAQHDPTAAAGFALGLPPEQRARSESLRRVVQAWSRNEPRATLAWVQKLAPDSERNDLINVTAGGWAQLEPEAAAAFALGHPPGRDRTILLNIVLGGWLNKNPAAAWTFAQSLPADLSKATMMQELLATWGLRDPAAALGHVNELPDPAQRHSMQDRLVSRLAEKDPATALDYARKLSGVERDSALFQIVNFLAERDPTAAETVAAEISTSEWRKYIGETLAGGLAKIAIATAAKHPEEAIKMVGRIPKGRQRSHAVDFVALEIAKHDPRAAMALAEAYSEAEESAGVRANVLPVWAMTDFDGAVAWVRQLPPGVSRDRISARLADQWAKRNPREAFVFMQSLADTGARNSFQLRLAEHWASADPTSARAAAESLPPGKIRDEFINCLRPYITK
jgi:hypothetical protein